MGCNCGGGSRRGVSRSVARRGGKSFTKTPNKQNNFKIPVPAQKATPKATPKPKAVKASPKPKSTPKPTPKAKITPKPKVVQRKPVEKVVQTKRVLPIMKSELRTKKRSAQSTVPDRVVIRKKR